MRSAPRKGSARIAAVLRAGVALCILAASDIALSQPAEVTTKTATDPGRQAFSEDRAGCDHYTANKLPLFGDLHIHTQLSYDSYISSQRNRPDDAYRYAKGEPIILPDAAANQTITAKIERPLDFAAVTDHAEFFGQVNMCTADPWRLGYWWPHCVMTRASNLWVQLVAANWWTNLGGQLGGEPEESFACTLSDCDAASATVWQEVQQAAQDHYDRSSECHFTAMVGYEYTDAPDHNNMHRNVIFRNATVTDKPISTYDTGRGNFPNLWRLLREQCIDRDNGCDVMTIPHNSNLSGGLMFRDPRNETELQDRLFFEPVVEIVQHKGASECRFDRMRGMGLGTEDELCDFEQIGADNLNMLGTVHGKVRTDRAKSVPLESFGRRNMLRNTLKDGLALEQLNGTNPFVMGFIGSTDTHSATSGGAEEDNYVGHLGRRDAEYRNVQDHFFSNSGGLAVVWAEENSRDAIFDALKRKETYATSGTRPVVRFFGGEYDENICDSPEMIDSAYANGVPMGGSLHRAGTIEGEEASQPSFLISAQKDAGSRNSPGLDLQRVQIIKGWVDDNKVTHEQVYDVAGDASNGASVNPNTCTPTGQGLSQVCRVWQDPQFNPNENAFYYARVVENPSCRWSTLHCQAAGVNPFADNCEDQARTATEKAVEQLGAQGDVWGKCCIDPSQEPFYSPTIQERAWTSPIWYRTSPEG